MVVRVCRIENPQGYCNTYSTCLKKEKIGLLTRFFYSILWFPVEMEAMKMFYKSSSYLSVDTVSIDVNEYQLFDYSPSSIFKTDSIDYFYGIINFASIGISLLSDARVIQSQFLSNYGPNAWHAFWFFFISRIHLFMVEIFIGLSLTDWNNCSLRIYCIKSKRSGIGKQKVGFLITSNKFSNSIDSESSSVFSIPTLWSQFQTSEVLPGTVLAEI